MPGITVLYSQSPEEGFFSEQQVDRGLGRALHDGYTRESVFDGRGLRVEVTRYPEYPIQRVVEEEFDGLVEGRLVSYHGALAPRLRAVWRAVKEGGQPSAIRSALSGLDGDFLVILRDRSDGRFILFNDRLGRLPTYYVEDGTRVVLSREPSVVASIGERRALDAVGATEFLVFGYPWGGRTLVDGMQRLAPASWVTGGGGRPWSIHREPEWDFSQRRRAGLGLQENASSLADVLVSISREQAGANNVLSLTGGLDSRSVGAALNKAEKRFTAATYLDTERLAERDVEVAGRVAEAWGVHWHTCELDPPKASDFIELLSFRYGANSLRMSFILPYFRWLREEFGADLIQFTGDGGLLLKPLAPTTPLPDASAVADCVLKKRVFSAADASELTGQPHEDVRDRLIARIEGLPEADLGDRFLHFNIYERQFNLYFEGEDRNRHFFWNSTPFYDWRFFSEAMACPERQKALHYLYASMLSHLDRSVANMPRAAFGGAVTKRRYRILRRVEAYLKLMPEVERVVQRFRRRRQKAPAHPELWKMRAIRSKGLQGVGGSLWGDRLIPWLDAREAALSAHQVDALLTIISLAELLETGATGFDFAISSEEGWSYG